MDDGARQVDGRYVRKRSGSFSIIESAVPEPGRDFPTDDSEFLRMFGTESACRDLVERLRFPRGFRCHACGERDTPWRGGTGILACQYCRHPTATTEGTIFHGTHIPLKQWFRALWELAHRESAAGSENFQEILGISDPDLAAQYLQLVRGTMALPAQEKLGGMTYLTATRLDNTHQASSDRPAVALILAREGLDRLRIRMRLLRHGTSRELLRFAVDSIEAGSRIDTPAWKGFDPLARAGFDHRVTGPIGTDTVVAAEPSIVDAKRVLSLLKLWLSSGPQCETAQLPGLLEDFVFRFNRRKYQRGLLWYRLMILTVLREHSEHVAIENLDGELDGELDDELDDAAAVG